MRARTDPRHMPSMLRTPTRARHHRPLTHTRPRCPLPSSRRVDRCHPITAYATARPLGANTTHPPTDHDAPLGDQAITSNREYSASSQRDRRAWYRVLRQHDPPQRHLADARRAAAALPVTLAQRRNARFLIRRISSGFTLWQLGNEGVLEHDRMRPYPIGN